MKTWHKILIVLIPDYALMVFFTKQFNPLEWHLLIKYFFVAIMVSVSLAFWTDK